MRLVRQDSVGCAKYLGVWRLDAAFVKPLADPNCPGSEVCRERAAGQGSKVVFCQKGALEGLCFGSLARLTFLRVGHH